MPGSGVHSSGSTSSSLIRRAQRHDPEAWRRLVALYGPLVFYWCRRSGLTAADAADAFQDVFASVSTAIERFRFDRENVTFRGWLYTITRNKLRDRFRRDAEEIRAAGGTEAAQRMRDVPDAWDDASTDPRDRSEMQSLFHRALDLVRGEFEDRTWQAFWRAVVKGDSTAEIAADLGISASAVRQHKSRVLRRLRQELGDQPE